MRWPAGTLGALIENPSGVIRVFTLAAVLPRTKRITILQRAKRTTPVTAKKPARRAAPVPQGKSEASGRGATARAAAWTGLAAVAATIRKPLSAFRLPGVLR